MSHEHHQSCCQHTDVKFCPCCRVVYCTACKKEWRDNSWSYTYTYGYPYGTVLCGSASVGTVTSDNATTTTYPDVSGSCKHSGAVL
jgi:hypothetical protein